MEKGKSGIITVIIFVVLLCIIGSIAIYLIGKMPHEVTIKPGYKYAIEITSGSKTHIYYTNYLHYSGEGRVSFTSSEGVEITTICPYTIYSESDGN